MSLIYFFMGIGLSMDAFSLALSLGTTNPNKKEMLRLSILVSIFHYIMPVLGYLIGNYFNNKISITNYLTSIIFIILAYELTKKDENTTILNIITSLIIALTVSIDSFTVGIALGLNNELIKPAATIFSITSFLFTLIGLILGKKLKEKLQKKATIIGIILLVLVALKYLFNV